LPAARGVLANAEATRVLRELGIPPAGTMGAVDGEALVRAAERLGYPVALKIDSPDIAHKTEVGGVRVGCADAASVRRAFGDIVASVRARAPAARVDACSSSG
jgi:acyl-CoA synthetase (NDP forming)